MTQVFFAIMVLSGGWALNGFIAREEPRVWTNLLSAYIFGMTILIMWELIVVGLGVSPVILPPPSMIYEALSSDLSGLVSTNEDGSLIIRDCGESLLCADFYQTFFKGVLRGYAMGCGAAFITAIAIDRSDFLKRGLLPIGNFVAALPIIGMAPILVMWFGFDWQSKAAVVVIMIFFPVLVNTMQGLDTAEKMQKDLMHTYAASYWQSLFKLRLPAAAPFIFNGLKIASTLALIGAIVAEFFGSPIVGMGFRISTGAGRLELDLVWAEIVVAAIAGSAFYGIVALIERKATFWHPSIRK